MGRDCFVAQGAPRNDNANLVDSGGAARPERGRFGPCFCRCRRERGMLTIAEAHGCTELFLTGQMLEALRAVEYELPSFDTEPVAVELADVARSRVEDGAVASCLLVARAADVARWVKNDDRSVDCAAREGGCTLARPAKRKRALLGSNPSRNSRSRNSRPETHGDAAGAGGRCLPASLSMVSVGHWASP